MYGLSGRELRFALLISSSHFAQHVYFRILPPLIPVLAVVLEYPLWQLGLLITMYSIGMSVAQAPLGILADRMDRLYLLPTGIAVTGAGYVGFAYAPVLGEPLAAITIWGYTFAGGYQAMSLMMLLIGVGLAVVHPAGYPMISDNIAADNKGKVLGVFGASSKLGDGVTPAVIAGLIVVLTWEWIIALFGVVGILYGLLLFGILSTGSYETAPARQRQAEDEASVLDLDGRRFLYPFLAIYAFFSTSGFTARGLGSFFPAFIAGVYAFSFEFMDLQLGAESIANLYFAVLLFAGAGMQLLLGGMADAHDPRTLLLACMGMATVGMVVLAIVPMHPAALLVVTIILGAGMFGVNPPRDRILSEVSPPEFEGRAFGYIFTAAGLTGALYPTFIGYIMEVVGYEAGFLVLAIGTILGAASIGTLYSERVYITGAQAQATTAGD